MVYSITNEVSSCCVTVLASCSGIKVQHPEFDGRARCGACFLDVGENTDTCDTDVRGHGTCTQWATDCNAQAFGVV